MIRTLIVLFISISFSYGHKLPPEVQVIVSDALSMDGDTELGRKIFQNSCSSCHGNFGVPRSSRTSSIPYLAGQTPKYLLVHMAMYKTKHRVNPVMNPVASRLSTKDMADLKEFLIDDQARSTHCNGILADFDSRSVERGRVLSHKKREFQRGDGSTVGVSCTMCHGENGLMSDDAREQTLHPDLAGQGKNYLKKQFLDFKSNVRVNAGPMNIMIRDLSKRDLIDLSSYYSSLDRCNN